MPPLNSLELEFPIINIDFRQFCASHGIFSVEDFLVHDIDVLVALAERHCTSNELKQGIAKVLSIIDNQHQPWSNGVEMLEDARQNKHVLSTGCEGIDSLLRGGLHEGQLIELVGPSSSGKTQVCQQAASHVAHKYRGAVVFVDTCNSFAAKRIACFINRLLCTSSTQDKCENLERIMSRILCQSVFDIFGLLDVLHQLELKLTSQVMDGDSKVRLLIIDSFSSLITPILGGSGAQGHFLMISAGFLLKKLAHEHNLSVLVTNHMVGGEGGIPKPALGESWKSVPHVRLLLSRDHLSNMCSMSILKHLSLVCQQAASHVAHKYRGAVVFVDTCNSFGAKRIACFINRLLYTSSTQGKCENLERIMSRLLCQSVFDIFGLLDVLHQLELKLASQVMDGDSKVRLLIIDSFSSLITPILGGSGAQGHSLMISAGFLLKKLAHEHNLSVLVTNHMVGGEGGIPKPALGESWKSVPHVRLLLSRDHVSNMCSMSILKHLSLASGQAVKFMIQD